MLILAAAPWSPDNHELFPDPVRRRARELARLGFLLAWSPRFEGESRALADVWLWHVLPHTLFRS